MTRPRRPRAALAGAAVALALLAAAAGPVPGAAAAAPAATPTPVAVPATVDDAVRAVQAAGYHAAVAVVDRTTGTGWSSGDADTRFPTESAVKTLIAARLLVDGDMTGAVEQRAVGMIEDSDDGDADALWGVADGPDLIAWAEQRYGIADLGAPSSDPGYWGNTKAVPSGWAELLADLAGDPAVAPWLLPHMQAMGAYADDGTDQRFGLAAVPGVLGSAAIKQGWGGDDDGFDSEGLVSTGLLDDGRFAVAVFVQHVPYVDESRVAARIDALSAAVVGALPMTPSPAASPSPSGAAGTGAGSGAGPGTASGRAGSPSGGSASPAAGSPTAAGAGGPGGAAGPGGSAGPGGAGGGAGRGTLAARRGTDVALPLGTSLAVVAAAAALLVLLQRRRRTPALGAGPPAHAAGGVPAGPGGPVGPVGPGTAPAGGVPAWSTPVLHRGTHRRRRASGPPRTG